MKRKAEPLYSFDHPTPGEAASRFDCGRKVECPDEYRAVIRKKGELGWVYRFRRLDMYADAILSNLNSRRAA